MSQLALRVSDLEASIAFYASLFGVEPAKRRPGYANFAITEPPLKLVLIEGEADQPTVMDHLGVEVETTDEVNHGHRRDCRSWDCSPRSRTTPPAATPCRTRCGSTAPGAEPWEVYTVKADAPDATSIRPAEQPDAAACCAGPAGAESALSSCC